MSEDADRGPRRVDHARVERLARELLEAVGEDPSREGLRDTPRRFADWWREFLEHDPGRVATSFESDASDQLVVVSGMRAWSLCEHHLLPFWCDVAIGYIPRGRLLGLSKLARVAHKHARRLQVQERLAAGVADEVSALSGSPDVAVLARGEHLCMTMRGARTPGLMTTSVVRGAFRASASARQEFFSLAAPRA
jgi:GTP cyclohydrolase I